LRCRPHQHPSGTRDADKLRLLNLSTLWDAVGLLLERRSQHRGAPGATQAYSWSKRYLQFVRCSNCGCVTHWEPIAPIRGARMGVNERNFEPYQLGAVRIRRLDGAVTEEYLD